MMEPEDTSQNDSTTPPAHTFNMQTGVAIILGKALLGFVFIILSAALSAADDFNVNEYMIMGFLGAYLLVDSALNFIPDSDVILINNRSLCLKPNKKMIRLTSMILLSLTMLILELSIGVAWWPAGKIIGVIISMLCLFISLINFSSVAITLGKALLGFVFIILSAAFSDDFNVGGYLIMGFLGAYLLVDSALYFIPDSDFVLMINNRSLCLKPNKTMIRLTSMVLLSLMMLLLELSIGDPWWPAGKIIGVIISMLCLFISALALFLTYPGRNLNLRKTSANNVPFNIGDFTLNMDLHNYLKNGWIGFNSDEDCKKQILQSRFLYFPFLTVLGLLSLTVVIEEFVIIGDWSCKNYLDDGVFLGVLCNCQYWAGISAACTIIIISLFFGGIYKPSLPLTMIAGTITLGYGIFMAMITLSSVQSLMIVGYFTDNDNLEGKDLILEPVTNRFLHLLPIQYLAVLMITLGVSFIGHCFFKAQEQTDICREIIKTSSLIGVVILTVVNMTSTQINVTEQLWKYWERTDYYKTPWDIMDIYGTYLISTLSLSLILLGSACFKILHANRTIPGTINWILSLCMLGFTKVCVVILFNDPYYNHYNDSNIIEGMILMEMPLWNFILNSITIWIGGIAGVFGLIYYSIDTSQTLVWISAGIVYPFICLASLCHFAMQYKIAATQKGPMEETEPQTAAADNKEPTATRKTGLGSQQLIPTTRNLPAISELPLLTLLNETEYSRIVL